MTDKSPDFKAIIPLRDGYVQLKRQAEAMVNEMDEVINYSFEATRVDPVTKLESTFKVYIDPKYVPILRIGHCFAKDNVSPVLILDSVDLSGQLVGLVMPKRR